MSKSTSVITPLTIELTLDEWFLIWAADKTARALGLSMTWEKTEHGVIIGMGKTNEEDISNDVRGRERARRRKG